MVVFCCWEKLHGYLVCKRIGEGCTHRRALDFDVSLPHFGYPWYNVCGRSPCSRFIVLEHTVLVYEIVETLRTASFRSPTLLQYPPSFQDFGSSAPSSLGGFRGIVFSS